MRILAILIMLILTPAASAEPVRLVLALEQGQTLAYSIQQDLEIATSIDEQEGRLTTTRHEADIRLTVRRLERDGSAVFALLFDRIEIEADAGGQSLAFEWTRSPDDRDDFVPTRESDRPGMVLAKTPVAVEIDAAGRVTGVSGLDLFLDEAMSLGDAGASFVGLFAPERLAATIEMILAPDGSARNALREPGSEWTVTRSDALPTVGTVDLRTAWLFERVEDDVAMLRGRTDATVRQMEDALSTVPRVSVGEQTHSTVVRWDTVAGRLLDRNAEQSLATIWTLGDQRVTQSQSATMTITRLDPPTPGADDEGS